MHTGLRRGHLFVDQQYGFPTIWDADHTTSSSPQIASAFFSAPPWRPLPPRLLLPPKLPLQLPQTLLIRRARDLHLPLLGRRFQQFREGRMERQADRRHPPVVGFAQAHEFTQQVCPQRSRWGKAQHRSSDRHVTRRRGYS